MHFTFKSSVVAIFVVLVLLYCSQSTEAMPRPGQISLSKTRNCFFSPMGCVFIPKMARIRKLSQDYNNVLPPPEYE